MMDTLARTSHGPGEAAREANGLGLIAHYAPKEQIVDAMVSGLPVEALCGVVWVPTRDGGRFPLCKECEAI